MLGPGWAEGMSINTIEPSPVSETSDNGRLSLELGHILAGQSYILFMQFQVNPTNVAFGRRADRLAERRQDPADHLRARDLTVFP